MINLSAASAEILKRLESNRFKGYIVGGAVRNHLSGASPDDIDITTDAHPEDIKEIFSDCRVIETGIRHGTVTVLYNNEHFEITTFRIEEGYADGRHPDRVIFSRNIYDDLKRRDFTMNSIAYNPSEGFIDPFNGKTDIENCIIRCVGNPDERFREDALRILRAIRFAAVTGFEIEKETSEAIFKNKELLCNVSAERIYGETVKMLCGKNISKILTDYIDVISVYIPQTGLMKGFNQYNYHHKYDLLHHTAIVTGHISAVPHMRISAFLHDIAKPLCISFDGEGIGHFYKHASKGSAIAEDILTSLRSDKNTIEKVVKLIKWHDTPIEEKEETIKRKLRVMGEETLRDLINLQRADTLGLADEFHDRMSHFDKLEEIIDKVIKDCQCFSLKDLTVNGNDMKSLGFKGKEIGKALELALDAVISDTVTNEKEILIEYIKKSRQ